MDEIDKIDCAYVPLFDIEKSNDSLPKYVKGEFLTKLKSKTKTRRLEATARLKENAEKQSSILLINIYENENVLNKDVSFIIRCMENYATSGKDHVHWRIAPDKQSAMAMCKHIQDILDKQNEIPEIKNNCYFSTSFWKHWGLLMTSLVKKLSETIHFQIYKEQPTYEDRIYYPSHGIYTSIVKNEYTLYIWWS